MAGCFRQALNGECVTVDADHFTDGHEELAVELQWRAGDEANGTGFRCGSSANDRWQAEFARASAATRSPSKRGGTNGAPSAAICKRSTPPGWTSAARSRRASSCCLNSPRDRPVSARHDRVNPATRRGGPPIRFELLLSQEMREFVASTGQRAFRCGTRPTSRSTSIARRRRSRAWYELFPRSVTNDPKRHGTFVDVIERLPGIRAMGFDVLYFPPIHPIGATNRKGRNNSLHAEPDGCRQPVCHWQCGRWARCHSPSAGHVGRFPPAGARHGRTGWRSPWILRSSARLIIHG